MLLLTIGCDMVDRLLTSIKCSVEYKGVECYPEIAIEKDGCFSLDELRSAILSCPESNEVVIKLGRVVDISQKDYPGLMIVDSAQKVRQVIANTEIYLKKIAVPPSA